MTLSEGYVAVDLVQCLEERDDILCNEAAREIKRLREENAELKAALANRAG